MAVSKAPGGSNASTRVTGEGQSFGRWAKEESVSRCNVTPLARAALVYGRAGLYVFPILELTKDDPLVKWGTRATCDTKQIAAWWRQWPHANIGCATGPSGLAVIDTDNKLEGNGEDTLRGLPTLTRTRMARTAGGGFHRFYRGEVGNTVGTIGPHVDTRGVPAPAEIGAHTAKPLFTARRVVRLPPSIEPAQFLVARQCRAGESGLRRVDTGLPIAAIEVAVVDFRIEVVLGVTIAQQPRRLTSVVPNVGHKLAGHFFADGMILQDRHHAPIRIARSRRRHASSRSVLSRFSTGAPRRRVTSRPT